MSAPSGSELGAARDARTATAFSRSWNNLPKGSIYSREQFLEWLAPIDPADLAGKEVLEMGFGNGSLLVHMADCRPSRLVGVELGDTLAGARANLMHVPVDAELHRGDLTKVDLGPFDLVYCVGVLHHLEEPREGFLAVLRHTRPGGRFHCWVYGYEGNALVRLLVEPVRRVASRLPWWLTKYAIALPLVLPYFVYAKALRVLCKDSASRWLRYLPLARYSLWIGKREFAFFHHVAFDQLVTPRTVYVPREIVDDWLRHPGVEPGTTYAIFRNGNSWIFGGRRRCAPTAGA